jgi:hypothetical protein
MMHDVEPTINIKLSTEELKIIIKELISDYMLDYSSKNKQSKADLFTHAQVFQKFFIRPATLEEWRQRGLISEYKVGDAYKYKIFEVFSAMQTVLAEAKAKKEEVTNG